MRKAIVILFIILWSSLSLTYAQSQPATKDDINKLDTKIDSLREDVFNLDKRVSTSNVKVDEMDKRISSQIESLRSEIGGIRWMIGVIGALIVALIALPQVVGIFQERKESQKDKRQEDFQEQIKSEVEGLKKEIEILKGTR